MATIVLQAAGSFLGGALGPIGAALGSAAGSLAGYALDRTLLEGTRRVEGPRLGTMRPFLAEEGAPLPRIYGTVRTGGQVIWATRFQEAKKTSRQGYKGGPKVTEYSYFANVAFAVCEGRIAGIRRIWADGSELDLEQVNLRVHLGGEHQAPDPLIEAKQGEGNAPAYRGVAYVVFDRLPLAEYGNRVPQFQFEVMRPVGRLHKEIRAVALIPGSTEFGLSPKQVTRSPKPGVTEHLNRQVTYAGSDLVASLDELQALCPNLEDVALVVTWFGDDLRAGQCRVRPAVTYGDEMEHSEEWKVSGLTRATAPVVSYVDGAAAYGGTPSDRSVMEAIAEIRSRGLKVTLYPFLMMDIPPGNGLPDPYGGAQQPVFPWRGRITCYPGPGQAGNADKSGAARNQVERFCGDAQPGDFAESDEGVDYDGPAGDWGYRRLVLHYARLAEAAGGVDAILLGSELRGLTWLRDGADRFPFVEQLCDLAQDVRSIVGAGTRISYGADWTEYFGYQPADGSGDVFYHLDPLWSHEAINAIGIDNYMPLSDWRDGDHFGGNPDGFSEPYDREGLRSQIVAGEGYDWFYQSGAARRNRQRTPIADGAHGKDWVFRYKDIRRWWQNQHFDRPGGVEAAAPTGWVPRSKPIWFTELGCPAVEKGPNQPNVFPDPKSSENAFPYFSSRGRSDIAQHRYLDAQIGFWSPAADTFEGAENPMSPIYGGRMLAASRIYVWAWDARPFPAFPLLEELWKDGQNWQLGHWLNGRLSGATAADLIDAILADHGLPEVDTAGVGGSLAGYIVEAPATARAALEPVVELFGIAVSETEGRLRFADEANVRQPCQLGELVVADDLRVVERVRRPAEDLPSEAELSHVDPMSDYQAGLARTEPSGKEGPSRALSFPGCLERGAARALVADWLRRQRQGRETIGFALPPSSIGIEPGTVITLPGEDPQQLYLVEEVDAGLVRQVRARRIERSVPARWDTGPTGKTHRKRFASAPHAVLLDLPAVTGVQSGADTPRIHVAAFAEPWRSQAVLSSPETSGFAQAASLATPATVGALVAPMEPGVEGRVGPGQSIEVELYNGELAGISDAQLFGGGNMAAVRSASGMWEMLQFAEATEVADSRWRLSRVLRGQGGTGDAMRAGAAAGAAFVLLDGAVGRVDLDAAQAGLDLNWRVGPSGQELSAAGFAETVASGGVRALTPLAPVHLRMQRGEDALRLSWVRRSRIDADNWLGEDIPLGEEEERYRLEIGAPGADPVRSVETGEPEWTYPQADMLGDFGFAPEEVEITVRQMSARVGAGLPATKRFALN